MGDLGLDANLYQGTRRGKTCLALHDGLHSGEDTRRDAGKREGREREAASFLIFHCRRTRSGPYVVAFVTPGR